MFTVTIYASATDTTPHVAETSWGDLVLFLADYASTPARRGRKKQHPAMTLARIDGKRANTNVTAIYGIAADIDTAPDDPGYRTFDAMHAWLSEQAIGHVIYTTTQCTREHHRYRVVMRYAHAIGRDSNLSAWQAVNGKFNGTIDQSTKDPARLAFLPALWTGDYRERDGSWTPIPDGFNAFAAADGGPILSADELAGLDAFPKLWSFDGPIARPTASTEQPKAPLRGKATGQRPGAVGPMANGEISADGTQAVGPMANETPVVGGTAGAECTDIVPAAPLFTDAELTVLSDWRWSPYVADWMRTDLPASEGNRDFRFLCAVAKRAMARGMPIDVALLADLGRAFSTHALQRPAPSDLDRQARSALKFAVDWMAQSCPVDAGTEPTGIVGNPNPNE